MNDIDLSSETNWTGLNMSGGVFDGNGHIIKNLKSTQSGLFDSVSGTTIKDIGVKNVDINVTEHENIGGLIGNASSCTISNCFVTGNITGTRHTGGLIGYLNTNSTVNNCYTDCNVNQSTNLQTAAFAGLVADAENSTINNCYTKGSVNLKVDNMDSMVNKGSAIIGRLESSNINNCYTTAEVNLKSKPDNRIIGYATSSSKINHLLGVNPDIIYSTTSNTTDINDFRNISQSEINQASNWASFDTTIWNKSTFPPTLKNMPKMSYYFSATNEFRFQVGEGSDPTANALFVDTGISMKALEIDLSTTDSCLEAVDCIKAALDAVTKKTADIGIAQSRLETISNVNTTKIENLTAAYSTVTEADVAEEVANFTKSQIMAQTAASLITQTQNFQANLLLRMISSLG